MKAQEAGRTARGQDRYSIQQAAAPLPFCEMEDLQ
jgi:hypothetical protein